MNNTQITKLLAILDQVELPETAINPDAVPVPDGFVLDSKGRHCPIGSFKQTDILKADYTNRVTTRSEKLQLILQAVRQVSLQEADDLKNTIFEECGVKPGGKGGNLTYRNLDQTRKVTVQVQHTIELGVELQAAKNLIDNCLVSWTADGNQNIINLINKVFAVDNKGHINKAEILSLRNLEIEDDTGNWKEAMDLISKSILVVSTQRFIRFYKSDEDKKDQAIVLDIAKL